MDQRNLLDGIMTIQFDYLNPDLDCNTAVIIGNGNVALDCARFYPRQKQNCTAVIYLETNLYQNQILKIYVIGRKTKRGQVHLLRGLRN